MTNLGAFSFGVGGGLFGAAFGYNMSRAARHLGYAAIARDFSAEGREIDILAKNTPDGENARNQFSCSEMVANVFGGIISMVGLSASLAGSALIGFKYFQESMLADDTQSSGEYSNFKMMLGAGLILTAAGSALAAYGNKTLRQNLADQKKAQTPTRIQKTVVVKRRKI